MKRVTIWWGLAALVAGCTDIEEVEGPNILVPPRIGDDAGAGVATDPGAVAEAKAPGKKTVQPAVAPEEAPPPSPRLEALPPVEKLTKATATYFEGHVGRRIYVQVDKPLYQPGETIWLKVWDLKARDLGSDHANTGVTLELVSPKGATVIRKRLRLENGGAPNDLVLPEGVQGGPYTIRATAFDGVVGEREIIVAAYEPPRIKKKLEFVRKAYGPGDEVTATIEVKRPTGEALANHPLTAAIRLDGQDLPRVQLTTNAEGGGLVRFTLPAEIERGDGLLTVLVEDGGVTESISKRIPVVLKKIQLSFFPEGGQMVEGLPTRLYFEAKNTIDKPADVEGRIVDDHGNAVARFRTYDRGLGRVDFMPATGRTYRAEITRPVGIAETYALPLPAKEGCVLRTFDDLDGRAEALRVAVRCSEPRKVVVAGVIRENLIDAAAVEVPADGPAVVYLKSEDEAIDRAQGVARVTVFDAELNPLAERIVFRNRRDRLQVRLEPDQESYTPREQVALKIRTTDPKGNPRPAELALAVVDDTVISFADDKKGHLLSRLLLEPEIPGEIEEPKFYFDLTEEKSALAMDLLMGTRGWRKFEWRPVLDPPPVQELAAVGTGRGGGGLMEDAEGFRGIQARRALRRARGRPMPRRAVRQQPRAERREVARRALPAAAPNEPPAPPAEARDEEPPLGDAKIAPQRARRPRPPLDGHLVLEVAEKPAAAGPAMKKDLDWAAAGAEAERVQMQWAPVRVFPVPDYSGEHAGPRTDFRETVFWAPTVKTDKSGEATVTFYLSDAVTSFRIFAEGVGGGLAGRAEEVFKSNLPFSMNVKLPVAVSAGDVIELPLTLTNEREAPLPVSLSAEFGELLTVKANASLPGPALEPKSRASLFYGVEVLDKAGKSRVKFSADAGGLKDEFVRELTVEPLGFPQSQSASGTLTDRATASFDLGEALPGTVTATVKLYPSPVATLVSGLEGMLREPSGCFEQTSSSNYPNVMIAAYLKAHDVADPTLLAKTTGLMERGYRRLVGYETKQKGFEWFGHTPPHEALTAYGLLEFADMKAVYGGVDEQMMARTAAWLKSRRDGKGGFLRDAKALDSFGRASPEVTDAYIVYALTEAGLAADFGPEIETQARRAAGTKDPYLLALATNSLLNVPSHRARGEALAKRLAGMQGPDGAWTGADHSITRSGGVNLTIETTALAVMALMKVDGYADAVRRGVEWLNGNRSGYGRWGATQATVLALEAMTQYATATRRTRSPGTVTVLVNGAPAGEFAYAAGHRDPIVFEDLGRHFRPGKNTVELRHAGSDELPYSIAVDFRSVKPATHPEVVVDLATALEKDTVAMGETVRLNVTLRNRTDQGQPMTLARVGLPGGLTFQTWQLKELVDKKLIDFYETRAREVVLYFRDLAPNEVHEIPLDLVAQVPGRYTGPASSAYLYYTDDRKFWTDGVKVAINR